MAENNRGLEVYLAIDHILPEGDYCADDCQQNCAEGHLKWLKQEHEGGDCR